MGTVCYGRCRFDRNDLNSRYTRCGGPGLLHPARDTRCSRRHRTYRTAGLTEPTGAVRRHGRTGELPVPRARSATRVPWNHWTHRRGGNTGGDHQADRTHLARSANTGAQGMRLLDLRGCRQHRRTSENTGPTGPTGAGIVRFPALTGPTGAVEHGAQGSHRQHRSTGATGAVEATRGLCRPHGGAGW